MRTDISGGKKLILNSIVALGRTLIKQYSLILNVCEKWRFKTYHIPLVCRSVHHGIKFEENKI